MDMHVHVVTYREWVSSMILVMFFLLNFRNLNFRNHTPFNNLKPLPFLCPCILDDPSPAHCLAIRVSRPQPKPLPPRLAVIRGVHTHRGAHPSSVRPPGGAPHIIQTADLVSDWTRETERSVELWAGPCRFVLVPQTGATSVADSRIPTHGWCRVEMGVV